MNRAWLGIFFALVGCICSPPEPPPPPPDDECTEDTDCLNPAFFFCDVLARPTRCEPRCNVSADCNEDRPEVFAIPECQNPLGCWCDEGRCVVSQCSDDSQCGALACRNGQCVDPPAASAVARCSIWPQTMVVTPGTFARFHVLATDALGEPIVVSSGASWQAMAPIIGSAQGHSVEVIAGATPTAEPVTAVRASFGSTQCEATWQVLPQPGMGELLTSVVDEGSGLPVPGAVVVLSQADGAFIEQQTTDEHGLARLTPIDSTSTLSVFHADFSYQTIANLAGKTRTIFFALKRNRADRHGGYVGRFDGLPATTELRLARAGVSSSAEALELSDELEPTIETNGRIGSIELPGPMPLATFMALGEQQIKPTMTVFAPGGGDCADASATANGTCSVKAAWALTAELRRYDYPFYLTQDGGRPGLIEVLDVMPVRRGFSSTVLRDLELRPRPAPLGPGGFPELRDTSGFAEAPLTFGQVRLGFQFAAKVPPIPRSEDSRYLSKVMASGVAVVPGRGLVPLGVGVSANEMPYDDQVDRREPLLPGVLGLRMAPPHHGVEGQPTAMVIQLYNRRVGQAGRETSAIVAPLPASLPFDPRGVTPIDLTGHAFPAVVLGQFDPRSRSFTASPVTNVSLVRVTFTDGLEGEWDVLVDPSAPAFTLPAVPGAFRDRVFRDVSGQPSQRKVMALRIGDARPFDEVIGENAAARPPLELRAWSQADALLPALTFASTPAILPNGAALELKTFGFDVGRDGKVMVTFEGGTGCPTVTLSTEPTRFTPLESCSGQSVVIRGELVDLNGAPLTPPVVTSFTTTIP